MSGILPRIVFPADVRDLKKRLDAVVRSLDTTATSCPGLNAPTLGAWGNFSRAWRTYFDEEESWIHTAAQMDQGEAYEKQIADWQRLIAASCTLNAPQITPSTSLPESDQNTIRTVAIAGAVIAVVVGIRSVMK